MSKKKYPVKPKKLGKLGKSKKVLDKQKNTKKVSFMLGDDDKDNDKDKELSDALSSNLEISVEDMSAKISDIMSNLKISDRLITQAINESLKRCSQNMHESDYHLTGEDGHEDAHA
jgi:hypothetical protein